MNANGNETNDRTNLLAIKEKRETGKEKNVVLRSLSKQENREAVRSGTG